jgi:EAL domain-containing protein (putative c-di-GMP-specific phosphodiesterase class I)/PAS domain-containing protein
MKMLMMAPLRMKLLANFLRLRWVSVAITIVSTGVLSAGLTATIYWTQFDPKWTAFLGGVLLAAMVAVITQASKAQWLAMRRAKQLDRIRAELGQETARRRNATEAARISESRLRLLADALPTMILFVDQDERCRYHNPAVEHRTGLSAEQISGRRLHEVLGSAYAHIAPHISESLEGKPAAYEFSWTGTALPETYAARHIPFPAEDSLPRGFCLLLTGSALQPSARTVSTVEPTDSAFNAGGALITGEGGQTIYMRSIADQLMGWDEPRANLENALKENQFLLFAQRILPLKRRLPDRLCYEILLRLREEEDNLLPPGGFIPIAERYGMMEDIDRWVVRSLIAWCMERKRADSAWRLPLYCVNLSESAVCSVEFARFVSNELRQHDFIARSLCFEISEPEIIGQHAHIQRFINTLKPLGCRFTVDAFGSVKASFTHLKGLAVDFLKIDGVIIQNILRDPATLAKTRAISTVCRKIGLCSIAEFVETNETLDKLREVRVDYVQGFGIARPQPIDKIP